MMIQFKIVTPERTVLEEDIYQITLPIEGGEVTILPNHIPYIGTVKSGEILIRKEMNGEETSLATSGGFVELHDNTLVVLADTAERAEEIDLARAETARRQAEEIMKAQERINRTIADETGQPLSKVREDTDRNFWMSSEEAKAYGLVGRIIERVDMA